MPCVWKLEERWESWPSHIYVRKELWYQSTVHTSSISSVPASCAPIFLAACSCYAWTVSTCSHDTGVCSCEWQRSTENSYQIHLKFWNQPKNILHEWRVRIYQFMWSAAQVSPIVYIQATSWKKSYLQSNCSLFGLSQKRALHKACVWGNQHLRS